jgi:predicted RNA binding protein YcfA (HicA-like mRNA interferase family)
MPPLPTLPGAEVVKALEKGGFTLVRVKGQSPRDEKLRRPVHRRTRPLGQGCPARDNS